VSGALLAAAVLAPLAAALAAPWTGPRGGAWAAVAAVPALVCALAAPAGALVVEPLMLGTRLELDDTGRALLGAFALLYGLAAAYGAVSVRSRPAAFWCWWGLSACGSFLVAAAADAVTFYLAFALLTFAAYGLVVHERGERSRRAGRVYVVFAVGSEAALLAGFVLAVAAAGGSTVIADLPAAVGGSEDRGLIVGLLVVGFGVKAGLLGLHSWLPLAHPVAPSAASAVLSGAMVKAGLLGWLRFLPLGEAELRTAGLVLVALGLAGALSAVVAGVAQGELKTVLAYSTVSQMGVMTALVGVAVAAPEARAAALVAVVVYAVHHGLAKGALFVGAGLAGGDGGAASRRLVVAGMGFAALVVAGAPLTGGQMAKDGAKALLEEGPAGWAGPLEWLLQASAAATAALVLHAVRLVRAAEPQDGDGRFARAAAPWAALLGAVLVLPWMLEPAFGVAVAGPSLSPGSLWESAWPIALGVVALGPLRRVVGRWAVPPGDVVVPLGAAAARVSRAAVAAGDALEAAVQAAGRRARVPDRWSSALVAGDEVLRRWSTGAALLVAVAAVIAAVLV
jgi:hydrogenase-4 component B